MCARVFVRVSILLLDQIRKSYLPEDRGGRKCRRTKGMKLRRAIMDQTRLAFCPPRGYMLKRIYVCVSKRMEGVGMYVSAIMIKVFPLRELAAMWWIVACGCTLSKASALQDLKTGQRTCCAENEDFHLL